MLQAFPHDGIMHLTSCHALCYLDQDSKSLSIWAHAAGASLTKNRVRSFIMISISEQENGTGLNA